MKIDAVLCKRLEKLSKITFTDKTSLELRNDVSELIEYFEKVKQTSFEDNTFLYSEVICSLSDLREDRFIQNSVFLKKKGYVIVPKIS